MVTGNAHVIKCPTLPETNIAPKNGCLEYYFPIGEAYFQVRAVSFREGTFISTFPMKLMKQIMSPEGMDWR